MATTISLVDALRPRACLVAEAIASRLPDPGVWRDYKATEGLNGQLTTDTLLVYFRPGVADTALVFRNPTMVDIKQVDWGEPRIIASNVSERFSSHIDIAAGVHYEDTISHTFTKSRTLLEQAKVGAELAVKVAAGAEGGLAGIKANVEVSAKISAEYSRQWGEQDGTSDTTSRLVSVDGPRKLVYEATRSLNKEQRRIRAKTDFEHTVQLTDERQGIQPDGRPFYLIQAASWAEFLLTVRGFSAADKEFYHEFINNPITGAAYDALAAPSAGEIEFLVEYDNVLAQDIRVV